MDGYITVESIGATRSSIHLDTGIGHCGSWTLGSPSVEAYTCASAAVEWSGGVSGGARPGCGSGWSTLGDVAAAAARAAAVAAVQHFCILIEDQSARRRLSHKNGGNGRARLLELVLVSHERVILAEPLAQGRFVKHLAEALRVWRRRVNGRRGAHVHGDAAEHHHLAATC